MNRTGTAGAATAGNGPPVMPALRVVAGAAGPEELAAVTAVVVAVLAARQQHAAAARQQAEPQHAATRRGGWPGRAALLRAPLMPGPGAWRRAAYPR
jgi:hypothetical protein